jgi:hypothetical protein
MADQDRHDAVEIKVKTRLVLRRLAEQPGR